MIKQVQPVRLHESCRTVGKTIADVESQAPAQTDPFHGFQIGGDAYLLDLPVHPVPPGHPARFLRWGAKASFQGWFDRIAAALEGD